jgi:hypothetical protein
MSNTIGMVVNVNIAAKSAMNCTIGTAVNVSAAEMPAMSNTSWMVAPVSAVEKLITIGIIMYVNVAESARCMIMIKMAIVYIAESIVWNTMIITM